ncbi:hypothetical protein MGG_16209 [Pyricularia oryzae 70-15]|uniref:Avirulence Effector AvrLm4-7 domain-containing protein n=1 Tax=Pyricularia oryzae (strain 70-15 / ATCC MYA-4617 / FGSC 8958) TaxID=242507 RepID=G4MMZ7_PYRO7|nr:uncharacterized protein MGG_16209 [Pyricularia oryzae 70-15]EHA57019.1 hypothetical protein MGG_16209 [Pyricularia oryzae 70-15]
MYDPRLAGRSIPSVWLFLTVYTLAECVWTGEASSGGNGDGDNWNGALQVRYCHAIYDGIAPLDQIVQLTDYRAACPGPIRIRHSWREIQSSEHIPRTFCNPDERWAPPYCVFYNGVVDTLRHQSHERIQKP